MFRRKKDAEELSCGFEVLHNYFQIYNANYNNLLTFEE